MTTAVWNMQLTKYFSITPVKLCTNSEVFLRDIFSKFEAIDKWQLLKKLLKETSLFRGLALFKEIPFCWGGGGGGLQPNFQKGGGLTGPQLLEWGCWEKGRWHFSRGWVGGGCNFHIKNKLKSEIFNDKKVYKRKYFSLSQLRN